MSIDRSFYIDDSQDDLADARIFNERVDTLSPSESITIYLGFSGRIFNDQADRSRVPLSFKIESSYNYRDQNVNESHTVDLSVYKAMRLVQKSIADELHKIGKALAKMGSS